MIVYIRVDLLPFSINKSRLDPMINPYLGQPRAAVAIDFRSLPSIVSQSKIPPMCLVSRTSSYEISGVVVSHAGEVLSLGPSFSR